MKKYLLCGLGGLLFFLINWFAGVFYYTMTYSMKNAFFLMVILNVIVCFGFCVIKLLEMKTKRKLMTFLRVKRILIVCYSLIAVFCAVYAVNVFYSYSVETENNFELTTNFFSDKKVMVIVPHQDDDILLVGGVVEQYAKAGSDVSVVFATHGDAAGIAETRINEAKTVLTDMGVKDVYFLGFGNRWMEKQIDGKTIKHIYNSTDENAVWTSVNGKTETYDVKNQNSYYPTTYTRNNFVYSMKKVILDNKPDIIYAVDYDNHIDHKAVGLIFDEAMGIILSENSDYRPEVFKGFAYGTSWIAQDVFWDSYNLASSKLPNETVWKNTAAGFSWDDRVRIPVDAANTNRIATNNPIYKELQGYESQFASQNTGRVLRGDRVFWLRSTESVLYRASILADGKETNRLNDFKIKDSDDISVAEQPNDGVVSASRFDIYMDESQSVDMVILYDSANEKCNILEGYIEFSNGDRVVFGELEKDGSATIINFAEREVDKFSVIIAKSEGDMVGLTEIEAYNTADTTEIGPEYIMPMDKNQNFAYNYWIESGDSAEFSLYSYPVDAKMDFDKIKVTYEGDEGTSCVFENGKISVKCPDKEQLKIKVIYDESVAVEFYVKNPDWWELTLTEMMRFFNKSSIYFDKLRK